MGIYNHREHMKTRQYQKATEKDQSGEQKLKGWLTPYGFCDFAEPVTYQEACHLIELIKERLKGKTK